MATRPSSSRGWNWPRILLLPWDGAQPLLPVASRPPPSRGMERCQWPCFSFLAGTPRDSPPRPCAMERGHQWPRVLLLCRDKPRPLPPVTSLPPPSRGRSAAAAACGLAFSPPTRNGAQPSPPVASLPPLLRGPSAAAATSCRASSSLAGTEGGGRRQWPLVLLPHGDREPPSPPKASRPPPLRGRSVAAAVSGHASPSLARTERGRRSHPHRTLHRRASVALRAPRRRRRGRRLRRRSHCCFPSAATLPLPLSPSKAAVAARPPPSRRWSAATAASLGSHALPPSFAERSGSGRASSSLSQGRSGGTADSLGGCAASQHCRRAKQQWPSSLL